MPSTPLMTWIPSQKRWTIRYRGVRYYVSCRQLGIRPETKEASVQAANDWWREKQESLDLAYREGQRKDKRFEDIGKEAIGSNQDWPTALRELLLHLPAFGNADTSPPVDEEGAAAVLGAYILDLVRKSLENGDPLPESLRRQLNNDPATPGQSIADLAERWLDGLRTQVSINAITAERFASQEARVKYLLSFAGESEGVSTITADTLEGFYHFCLSRIAEKRWSRSYAKSVFAIAKQFVLWLVGRGTIASPANLRRQWRFGPATKQVQMWPLEDVRRIIDAATGKQQLCLLLMLNTGATQKDVADLRDDEVNWREGRIVRKRSKTHGIAGVPVVNYLLWPSTFALLKEHRSGQENVLLTKSGSAYVNKRLDGKTVRRTDAFGTMLRVLTNKLGIKHPIKGLRKTAASLLESHEVYGRYVSYFLGHAPQSMSDKHYTVPSQDLFDAAVTWLGEQIK